MQDDNNGSVTNGAQSHHFILEEPRVLSGGFEYDNVGSRTNYDL